jgi:hypothetical protein
MSEPTSQPLSAPSRSVLPLGLSSRSGPPLGLIFGGIGLLAALAVGVLRLDRLGVPLCYVKAFTGLPCPTCGSTRVLARLFDLDFAAALAMNPLATLAFLVLAAWAFADLVLLTRGRALGVRVEPRAANLLRVAALGAVLANWLYLLHAGR